MFWNQQIGLKFTPASMQRCICVVCVPNDGQLWPHRSRVRQDSWKN